MSAPTRSQITLQPPRVDMQSNEAYKFNYELWTRSGGYTPAVTNLTGLQASVKELNTLIGIDTQDTVQDQLNQKVNSADIGTIAEQDYDNVTITGGSITTVTIGDSAITVRAGSTSNDLNIGGTLTFNTTPVGNVGAGEDTLITYAMEANTLNTDGNYLEISAWGITAANANNKEIKLKIGTTTLLATGAVAANNASWFINARIIRTGAATQQVIASILSDNALIVDSATYTDAAENLAAALNLFCTGEGVADDDIIQKGLIIKWYK